MEPTPPRARKPLMKGLTFFGKTRPVTRKPAADDSALVQDTALENSLVRTASAFHPPDAPLNRSPNKTFTMGTTKRAAQPVELLTDSSTDELQASSPASDMSFGSTDSDADMSVSSQGSANRGIVVLQNGDAYQGACKDGLMHGLGVLHHRDGRVYKGDFLNSMKHGVGITRFPNGDKHIGLYSNNFMSGRGTFLFSEGHRYVGQWSMDKFHGVGTVTYASGEVFYGEFFDGCKKTGSYIMPSGDICALKSSKWLTPNQQGINT